MFVVTAFIHLNHASQLVVSPLTSNAISDTVLLFSVSMQLCPEPARPGSVLIRGPAPSQPSLMRPLSTRRVSPTAAGVSRRHSVVVSAFFKNGKRPASENGFSRSQYEATIGSLLQTVKAPAPPAEPAEVTQQHTPDPPAANGNMHVITPSAPEAPPAAPEPSVPEAPAAEAPAAEAAAVVVVDAPVAEEEVATPATAAEEVSPAAEPVDATPVAAATEAAAPAAPAAEEATSADAATPAPTAADPQPATPATPAAAEGAEATAAVVKEAPKKKPAAWQQLKEVLGAVVDAPAEKEGRVLKPTKPRMEPKTPASRAKKVPQAATPRNLVFVTAEVREGVFVLAVVC